MNVRRAVRAAIVAVLLTGASLGLLTGTASALPPRCVAIQSDLTSDQTWAAYYWSAGNVYYDAGNYDTAGQYYALWSLYNTWAKEDEAKLNNLGC